jgi:hypothetical protein
MLMRVLLYVLLIYIGYKFIFNFIIPVYKTTQKLKKGFRDIHGQMQDQMKQQQAPRQATSQKPEPKAKAGEYIDFEDVK